VYVKSRHSIKRKSCAVNTHSKVTASLAAKVNFSYRLPKVINQR